MESVDLGSSSEKLFVIIVVIKVISLVLCEVEPVGLGGNSKMLSIVFVDVNIKLLVATFEIKSIESSIIVVSVNTERSVVCGIEAAELGSDSKM